MPDLCEMRQTSLNFNHKVLRLNQNLPDERSNCITSHRTSFYSNCLVSPLRLTIISLHVFLNVASESIANSSKH